MGTSGRGRAAPLVTASALMVAIGASVAEAAPVAPDGASSPALSEVVVVARKRSENLQTTPVAVTSVTGDQLVERSVTSFRDLQQQTPSLIMVQASTGAASSFVAIRGQSYADIQLTADPAVGVYVDGVYQPRLVGTEATDLTDVDHVEVLKGAQGTLFGRNTTGGAINIISKAPTDQFGGYFTARVGNFDIHGLELVLNVPITDKLAIRLVGEQQDQGATGLNLFNDGQLGDKHVRDFRGTARWLATDKVTVTVRGDVSSVRDDSAAVKPLYPSPSGVYVYEIGAETGLSPAAAYAAFQSYAGGNFYNASLDVQPLDKVQSSSVSATVDWKINEHLSFKSITAGSWLNRDTATDLDGSPFQIIEFPHLGLTDSVFSQEVQLLGNNFGGRLDWIVGTYYSREEGGNQTEQIALELLAGNPSLLNYTVVNASVAVFGQGTYAFNAAWSLTGGVRYTKDDRELTSTARTPTACLATGLPLGDGACSSSHSASFSDPSYTVGVEYKPNASLMLYLKTDSGYRSGGLPGGGGSAVSPAAAAASFEPFRPETVRDYEFGVKSEWLDHTLRANLAVYHTDYSDIQLDIARLVPGTSTVISAIDNVASGVVDGSELEVLWRPISPLELRASTAWTDARYTQVGPEAVADGTTTSTPFRFTPKWSYSLSAAYTAPTAVGPLRSQIDYDWDAKFNTSATVGRAALGLLNGRISLHLNSADLDVAVFARNITNEKYSGYSITVPLGYDIEISGIPRTYGVELTKHF